MSDSGVWGISQEYFDKVYGRQENRVMANKNWIQGAIKHPGGLHRALGVPANKRVPASDIQQALKSKNPHLRKMAQLAKTLKGMR